MIFTAHSLPERVRSMGDTYPEQLEQHPARRWPRPPASPAGWWPGRAWPHTRTMARPRCARRWWVNLGRTGHTHGVVVCPIGFVVHDLEILYDIDIELADVALRTGLRFARTASLNDDSAFMGVLADVVCTAAARCD